jgi:hypothetical protein
MEQNNKEISENKFEIPYIEKKLGDLKNNAGEYEEAIGHYKKSILSLKILFDEEGLLDETKATQLIEEIGVELILTI